MRYITFCGSVLTLVSFVLAQQQPCYNHADPDLGLPNYCECNDGTCWAISSNDCSPPSSERLDPCPVGDRKE
ncbi:hypothetical protein F5Y03DRAFT_338128 [Xylaria venustula]|nr:hypothetical protein F5Y03DRAFT_338128 [Xylaria venustula]